MRVVDRNHSEAIVADSLKEAFANWNRREDAEASGEAPDDGDTLWSELSSLRRELGDLSQRQKRLSEESSLRRELAGIDVTSFVVDTAELREAIAHHSRRVDEMRAELLKLASGTRDNIERLAHIEQRLDEAVSLLGRLEMRIESGSATVQRLGSAVADHTTVLDQTRDAVRQLQIEQRNARRRRDAAVLFLAGGVLLASIGMVVVSRL
jgi:methyl-accepting chemotaxis protein